MRRERAKEVWTEEKEAIVSIPEIVMKEHLKDIDRLAGEVRLLALQRLVPSIYEAIQKGTICVTEYDQFDQDHFVSGDTNRIKFWLDLYKGISFEEYKEKYPGRCLITDLDLEEYRRKGYIE
jgi:hypothetical protein